MGNIAYADFRKPRAEGERVADTDDGYTRLANELLEAVMSADLTARQLKIFMAIVRKTYGFGKKLDRITNTQIAEMTGIHHTHVCTAKNEMILMNVLINRGNLIGINKVISEWNFNISQVSETLAKSANKSLAKSANGHSPSQLNTKETIQNKKENKPTLTRLEGGEDDNALKEKLISMLQGRFNFDNAKDLHNAVETEILKSGFLCQREFIVPDRGDGRRGKVDLYVKDPDGGSCGIEIDWKSPREKSITKLQQLPAGFVLLRETHLEERYEISGIPVVNSNTGETDQTPAGYYQSFLDAYNEITDMQLPPAKEVNSGRKRALKILINKLATPNVEGFRAYVKAFMSMAKPFYFGENDRGWTADFDYLLRPNVLTKIREGNL
jgi:phage replication O-like protein O